MKKHMTDEDIIDLFDSSADKEAVVDAVAVSLRTTRTGAREKLRELGCEIDEPLDGFVPVEPKRGRRKRAAPEPAAVAPTACQPGQAVDVSQNDIEPAPEVRIVVRGDQPCVDIRLAG